MKRASEKRLPRTQPTWKLLGNGSVGGQALVGIHCVAALRDDPALSPCSRVWPFETGFTATPASGSRPAVIHAEIWPGVVPINLALHGIRDAAQVMTLARHFATEDAAGRLGALFATPTGLSNAEVTACIAEEGWILGA
jgi:precorrin-8X/cobalt-precorrin-8 methylmutase